MIGKRYTKPLILVMLVAFFSSVICMEILAKQNTGIVAAGNTIEPRLIGLSIFGVICQMLSFGILIWLGTYHFLMKKMRALSVVAVLIGMLLLVGLGSFSLLARWSNEQLMAESINPQDSQLGQLIHNKDLPLVSRAMLSQAQASVIYDTTGKTVQVMDENGKLKTYTPTRKDIEQWNQFRQAPIPMPVYQIMLLFIGLGFFFVAALSLTAGFFCARIDQRAMAIQAAD